MCKLRKECYNAHEAIAKALPLITALFWNCTQIPTLDIIRDPYHVNTFKDQYWILSMKNDMKDNINKMQDKCDDALSNVKDLGEKILRSMVPGWKSGMIANEVQPQWDDRLKTKVTYSMEDLEFASGLQADILCFENHRSYWREELENVDSLLEGIQYKMFNPPMPPTTKLFELCLRFQDYVRVERATDRDIQGE